MLEKTESFYEAMKVYDQDPFDPHKVHNGVGWRRIAMTEWQQSHRPGLCPLVSDKVPIQNHNHCLACGSFLDPNEEDRESRNQLYPQNVCGDCNAARRICFPEYWEQYKETGPREKGLQ